MPRHCPRYKTNSRAPPPKGTDATLSGLRTPDIGDRLCSARVVFDLVAQGELGAGVAGGGGVELVAQGGEGAGSAGRGQRVEPDGQGGAAGDDVAAGGKGFADQGVCLV